MKETLDPVPAEQSADQEGFANRKLIRPSLSRTDHNHGHNHLPAERRDRPPASGKKAGAPTEQTNAENFYYQKQMQTKTPMVVVLRDGEEVHGYIEWYDKSCIKPFALSEADSGRPNAAVTLSLFPSTRHNIPSCRSTRPRICYEIGTTAGQPK